MDNMRQLDSALSHVSSQWFPPNPTVHKEIREAFAAGRYQENIDLVIRDVKKDPALFTFCLKELVRMVNEGGESPLGKEPPTEALKKLGMVRLRAIIDIDTVECSTHVMTQMTDAQARALRKTLVSSFTAETLAPAMNMSPEIAYSCAILRQLGHTLIAWNYPTIYAKALASSENIDTYLNRTFGFSPSLLAVTVARSWGLSPEVRIAIGDKSDDRSSFEARIVGETLQKICRIGEMFAGDRGSPEWASARDAIVGYLGERGLDVLERRLAERCGVYYAYAPHCFPLAFGGALEEKEKPASTHSRNPYVTGIDQSLQPLFDKLYEQIDPGCASKESVDYLLNDIVPKAGFDSGCVYLVELDHGLLLPRLFVGNARKTREFKAVRFTSTENESHPVVKAYKGSVPISGRKNSREGEPRYFVAGAVGNKQRAGVLYLESTKPPDEKAAAPSKQIIKAIRQALTDCLGLG